MTIFGQADKIWSVSGMAITPKESKGTAGADQLLDSPSFLILALSVVRAMSRT